MRWLHRIVLGVSILILIGAAIWSIPEEEKKGGGSVPSVGLRYDEEFGNVQVQGSPQNTNEVSAAFNPADPEVMVAAANDYSGPINDAWVGYYYSEDAGSSWKKDLIPGYPGDLSIPPSPLLGFSGAGDPVVAYADNRTVYIAGIAFERTFLGRSAIFVAKSTDGGRTFPSSQISLVAQGDGAAAFHDKEWIAVDRRSGNVYVTWSMFTGLSTAQIVFSRSTDGGETWSDYMILSETLQAEIGVQGSQIVVDSHGNVHVIWIDFDRNVLRYTRSEDMGLTFSSPVDICTVQPIPIHLNNNTYRTPTIPTMAVDTSGTESDGYLYIAWNDMRNGDADILLVQSSDGGDTWSDPVRVNDDPFRNGKDQFFPALTVSPSGLVTVVFYDRRDDPHNTMLSVYGAVSEDQGREFKNIRLSDVMFDGEAGGGSYIGSLVGSNAFIGDYIGAFSTDSHIYGFWCDTRNGDRENRNSDIYTARLIVPLGF